MGDMIPAWVNGELTPVEKLEAHQKGLRHKAISVFVMDGDKVLIQRRALGKYHTPGFWANTCCTHPAFDESSKDCAARRLKEELGITGLPLEYRETVEYRADVGNGLIEHEVVDIFVAPATADLKWDLNPDEVMDVRWVSLPDLAREVQAKPDSYTPWLQIYLDQHAASIFGDLSPA
ncbi:isopentenyl-diphosphate Delta-isomerase [Rhodovulum adriaticum]|uniref:Isopentenyl-diphosphate Delta-isomerase n=1 Tax=Rhodovulum adriaticum TaxID=35804 RepID=A0A4R2NZG2_RHOAD|nr:isopentenyl-diphosphate Delta-isomerase [Rhodovulum adriaticum]MBK1635358.1 isopentenyl-diphosphate delta-isomerase [Rhodovulum adriaticum]TCP27709.1 isopentenyl-diphosphate delta-isomerase [Rhodovulum adriaticum]